MNGRVETCHCGHDKSSHYVDRSVFPPKVAGCLGLGGCACTQYVHRDDPLPKTRLRKPNHPAKLRGGTWCECECHDCKAWRAANPMRPATFGGISFPSPDDEEPDTDPNPTPRGGFGPYGGYP